MPINLNIFQAVLTDVGCGKLGLAVANNEHCVISYYAQRAFTYYIINLVFTCRLMVIGETPLA